MTLHVYPNSAMLGDYLRAAAGFVPSAAILATTPVNATAIAVLGSFALLFSVFGIRTALRHGTRFEMTETGLRASGLIAREIVWDELERLKLTYYSTRRDRRDGWMQIELGSGRSSLRIDSRIDGFQRLVETASRAAELRGLALSPVTAANLAALGIRIIADDPVVHSPVEA